ncbi:MAG: glycoside hydrolase family 31 protein [Deltaproteobacteria bacterium]|nr:glycoside hydrolase family 31 protein [Deltaproteobacteria bacterium]
MAPHLRAALLPVLLTACTGREQPPDPTGPEVRAGTVSVHVAADGRSFSLRDGATTLLDFPADALQLGTVFQLDPAGSYDPYWLERDDVLNPGAPDDLAWDTVSGSTARADGADAVVESTFTDGTRTELRIAPAADGRFRAAWRVVAAGNGTAVAWMRLRPRAAADEAFYGLGEWPDDVNHRGKLRPMQLEADLGIESASTENHVVVPLLIGTGGWGLFVEDERVGAFDVARKEPTLVEVTYAVASGEPALAVHLFAAAHPLDVTAHYLAVTGAPVLPAPWALGPWIWRDENRDQVQVLDDVAKIRELDLATSGMWIDRPYASHEGAFDYDAARFPDPAAMVDALHAAGLRYALWHVPYVEEGAEPYRTQAVNAGFFPSTHGPLLNSWSEPLDFTLPAAWAFWQEGVRRYTDAGVEGFKLDYAEDVLPALYMSRSTWEFGDGSDERVMHHRYPALYHRAYAELLPPNGGFLLCRAGRWGGQRYASVIWPGDLDATFTRYREVFTNRAGERVTGVGGLPSSIAMGLGLGPSGYPFFGADTGGYRHSPPSKELFLRWTQQTALSSVMQVGDSSSQPPWEFTAENGRDQEAVDIYRVYARLHLRLFPYEWTLAQQIATTGRPIQRPLGLAHPELGEHPSDTYLFGDDLLVAPVIVDGDRTREVPFPAGRWVDWWDGTVHDGPGHATVDAPLERLPLFIRQGAIIPLLRPTIDTLAPATLAGVESFAGDAGLLYVRAVPPGSGSSVFTVYDGTRLEVAAAQLSVASGSVFTAGFVLELLGVPAPASVTLDGTAATVADSAQALQSTASSWRHVPESGGALWIHVPGGTHQVLIASP